MVILCTTGCNIQKLYILPAECIYVFLYGSQDKQQFSAKVNWLVFIIMTECVYCAVRIKILDKTCWSPSLSRSMAQAVCHWSHHGCPDSIPGRGMWDAWLKSQWDGFLSEFFGLALSVSFHRCSVLHLHVAGTRTTIARSPGASLKNQLFSEFG